jgi:hypothetical protein
MHKFHKKHVINYTCIIITFAGGHYRALARDVIYDITDGRRHV